MRRYCDHQRRLTCDNAWGTGQILCFTGWAGGELTSRLLKCNVALVSVLTCFYGAMRLS